MNLSSKIVGQIYDAAFDSEIWPELMCEIADFTGVENAALISMDPSINFSSVVTPRADPNVISDYENRWWEHDPTAEATATALVGQITDLDTTGRKNFFASAFYNDYWRQSGLGAERIATNLLADGKGFSSFVLQASSRHDEIGSQARNRFEFLIPHLIRSVGIARRLQRLDFEKRHQTKRHEGCIIIDANHRILFLDEVADHLFEESHSVGLAKGQLRLVDDRADAALSAVVATCFETRFVSLAGGKVDLQQFTGEQLTLEVNPFNTETIFPGGPRPVATVFVENPNTHRNIQFVAIQRKFGFTPAEARLALEMLKGDGRAAAASRCGISINTVRTQLSSVFEKAGVSRQAELIKVLIDLGTG